MSDLGLLSHQYQELTEMSQRIRAWVVSIKRKHYGLDSEVPTDEPEQLAKARFGLANIALYLRDMLELDDQGLPPEKWISEPPLPISMVDRLRLDHQTDRDLFSARLQRLASRLSEKDHKLTEKDIAVLDEFLMAASADTNAVFRRLMRWS